MSEKHRNILKSLGPPNLKMNYNFLIKITSSLEIVLLHYIATHLLSIHDIAYVAREDVIKHNGTVSLPSSHL